MSEPDQLPVADGFFWATHKERGYRTIVLLQHDRTGKERHVYTHLGFSRCSPETFVDYSGPIKEEK